MPSAPYRTNGTPVPKKKYAGTLKNLCRQSQYETFEDQLSALLCFCYGKDVLMLRRRKTIHHCGFVQARIACSSRLSMNGGVASTSTPILVLRGPTNL
jgi:hypothetical protein